MALQARTGIGTSANSIELGGPNLQLAALSQSGGIFLTSSEETTISDVADLSGLQIADSSPQVAGNIQFTSRGSMTIESSVVNSSGGNITLQSGNHLRVLPSVAISTVGSGTLTLRAGERPAGDISINFGSLSLENDTVISTCLLYTSDAADE